MACWVFALVHADEVGKRRDSNKQLLEQFSEAVRVRQGHDLQAALNASLARIGMQSSSVAVVHIMAGLMDPSVAVLHDTMDKLCQSAQASRYECVTGCLKVWLMQNRAITMKQGVDDGVWGHGQPDRAEGRLCSWFRAACAVRASAVLCGQHCCCSCASCL